VTPLAVIADLLRPVSEPGEVKLRSGIYYDPPQIDLAFFGSDLDFIAIREGVRFMFDILNNDRSMKDIIG
jgi:choline dehydrogenase